MTVDRHLPCSPWYLNYREVPLLSGRRPFSRQNQVKPKTVQSPLTVSNAPPNRECMLISQAEQWLSRDLHWQAHRAIRDGVALTLFGVAMIFSEGAPKGLASEIHC